MHGCGTDSDNQCNDIIMGLSNHRNEPQQRNGATKYRNGYNKYRNRAYDYRNWHNKNRNGAFNYQNGAITYQNGAIYLYKDEYSKMKIPNDTMNKAWIVGKYDGMNINR